VSLRAPHTLDQFHRFDDALRAVGVVRLSFRIVQVRNAVPDPPEQLRLGALETPCVGDDIDLGIGALFTVDLAGHGPVAVGVLPTEQILRPDLWLDPAALYRSQHQLGVLTAHPYRAVRRPAPYPSPAPA
jgi:hypothetical protein